MKNKNIILGFEDVLNTYNTKIPPKQLNLLKSSKWVPLQHKSILANECAYLIGKVMGDGHLDKHYTLKFIGQKDELIFLRKLIVDKFDIDQRKISLNIKHAKGVSYILQINFVLLGRLLYVLGAPVGNKTKQSFLIPNWILKNKESKRRFLQAILEDELTTIKISKSTHSTCPKFKLAKKEEYVKNLREFMYQIKQAIESFGVTCSHLSRPTLGKSNLTLEIYFHIDRNKDNIIKFAKEIGFRSTPKKVNELNKCIKILEKTRHNRKPFIETKRILNLRKKGYSIREIGRIVNLNSSTVHRIIKKK